MLNQPIPDPLRDVLDRAAEVCRDSADRIEHFSAIRGEREAALKNIRAAVKVIHGIVDEEHTGRAYLDSLATIMQARTVGDLVRAAKTPKGA
jgi:hypothetical protein